jgi:hypothetical protein
MKCPKCNKESLSIFSIQLIDKVDSFCVECFHKELLEAQANYPENVYVSKCIGKCTCGRKIMENINLKGERKIWTEEVK